MRRMDKFILALLGYTIVMLILVTIVKGILGGVIVFALGAVYALGAKYVFEKKPHKAIAIGGSVFFFIMGIAYFVALSIDTIKAAVAALG